LSAHYVCVLTKEGPLDNLSVKVETRSGIDPQSAPAQAAAQALMHDSKAYIGTSLTVQLCGEGEVERSQGKAKRVLDLRQR
jgi:phenylacetate-CoA ligase